jgi:hypothetical protein
MDRERTAARGRCVALVQLNASNNGKRWMWEPFALGFDGLRLWATRADRERRRSLCA